MAGLNNLLSDTQQTQTTMPAWYDQAQQNIMSQGATAAATAPTFGQTTAQGAVNTLQGPANPFTQAQTALGQIASGAANPWITDASGYVTPNTATPLGGLFAAQEQQLNQLLPTTTAQDVAGTIGSGNFGSLRGQTAIDTAKANALSTLRAQQLQAALTNQQAGATAATGLGNVGQQGINAAMNVGAAQMNAPFSNLANYANLLGSMQTPTTTTQQVQMSPLTQAATLANVYAGAPGVTGALGGLLFGKPASGSTPATSGLFGGLGSSLYNKMFGSTTPTGGPGTYPLEGGGSVILNADGSKTVVDPSGSRQYFDQNGNPMTVAQDMQNQNIIPASGQTDTSGNAGSSVLDSLGINTGSNTSSDNTVVEE